jgi:hypothetical protein
MSDRLSAPPADRRQGAITLASQGKTMAKLLGEGRYLEVAERGCAVTFDLWESARLGRAVVVWMGELGDLTDT